MVRSFVRAGMITSVLMGAIALTSAPASAHPFNVGTHHGDDAASVWTIASVIAAALAMGLGLAWLRRPARRRQPILRLAIGAGVCAIALAACGSVVDSSTGSASGSSADGTSADETAGQDGTLISLLPEASGYSGPRPADNYAEDLSAVAAIAGEVTGLPDLITDPPVPREVQDIDFAGHRIRVARFDGYVTNQGPGILDMFGDPTLSVPGDLTSHSVWQRIWNGTEWENLQQPPVRFESADGHNHFHLMEIARYSMWDGDKQAEVAPGEKVGFCLFDSEQFRQNALPAYLIQDGYFCRQGAPLARVLRMGISPGWRDLYAWDLALQWVDASNVIPGEYYVAAESDPFDQVLEADETNNGIEFSEEPMVIPGYNALPSVVELDTAETYIEVGAELQYETIGEPEAAVLIVITRLPEHGELHHGDVLVETGVPYPGDFIYQANSAPNSSAPEQADSFEFEAIEAEQEFPLFPQRATVVLQPPGFVADSLAIGGQQNTIYAGTSVQMIATDGGVVWSVEGSGSIGADGRYRAAEVAESETVVIAATSGAAVAEAEITVEPRPNRLPHIEDPLAFIETGLHTGPIGGPTVDRVIVDTLEIGVARAFMVPVLDADGEAVTVRAEGLPPGMTIDAVTAVVAGVPTEAGSFDVTVYGDDGKGVNSHTFALTVS